MTFLELTLTVVLLGRWSTHIFDLCGKLSRVNFALRNQNPTARFEECSYGSSWMFSSIMLNGFEVWGGSTYFSQTKEGNPYYSETSPKDFLL